ncbi:MAG TPA: methyltransferase domain-containing protein [Firmicutes bacterium]|nr:methyltransferase domain-containing protein [Bacillota bacterium]
MTARSRWDREIIYGLIPPAATVLDLGCGNGELLSRLMADKQVKGYGIDRDITCITRAVARGVPILHADLEESLAWFPDAFFDFVVLEQTLHVLRRPFLVLGEMLRIGRAAIVSFPNFAHWQVTSTLTRTGRLPSSFSRSRRGREMNIYPLTAHDFLDWARERGATVVQAFCLTGGSVLPLLPDRITRAEEVLFLIAPAGDVRAGSVAGGGCPDDTTPRIDDATPRIVD